VPSRRTYFLQDDWYLETPICSLATSGECLYTSYVKTTARTRPSELLIIVYVLKSCVGWNFLSAPAPHRQKFEKSCPLSQTSNPHRPRPGGPPNRPGLFPSQIWNCHGKPLKTHATCFIANGKFSQWFISKPTEVFKKIYKIRKGNLLLLMSLSHALSQLSVIRTIFLIPRPGT